MKKTKRFVMPIFNIIGFILIYQFIILINVFADSDWQISPYPDGLNFAFTIIHDADSANSKRLAPLFDEFDKVGLKVTVTVFPFWGEYDQRAEARNEHNKIQSVPLEDREERKFYKQLAKRGHEIAMHTPSDTSDKREKIIRAYEYFKKIFGYYPRVYVEHSRQTNKEAQNTEGSNPQSPYYNTDLLNYYQSWVWVDGPGGLRDEENNFYDILQANGPPFSTSALETYGIIKGFVRTGKWPDAGGNGFLNWYSLENIDSLEQKHGLALVYTHLDRNWLDPETRKMRQTIKDRLIYITSKNGWFVPAGEILDRLEAISKIYISYNDKWLKVINTNQTNINGLTLISNKGKNLSRGSEILLANKDKKIIIGDIKPHETLAFQIRED